MNIVKNTTTAGTPVRLVATTVTTPTERFCARVTISGRSANTQAVYVTQSNSTPAAATGFKLEANDSVPFGQGETRGNSIDLATIWVDSDVNGEGVVAVAEQI